MSSLWLTLSHLAADAASGGTDFAALWGPIAGVLGMAIAGTLTLIGTFRTSGRAAQTQRDAQLDERADKQYRDSQADVARLHESLEKKTRECEERTRERDDYRERWTRLRVAAIARGLDPDEIIGQKGGPDATRP